MQLSYALNSEAREGAYQVTVSIGSEKIQHSFKVEKYGNYIFFYITFNLSNEAKMLIIPLSPVLPKFDLQMNAPDEVSINQEEVKAEVCAT